MLARVPGKMFLCPYRNFDLDNKFLTSGRALPGGGNERIIPAASEPLNRAQTFDSEKFLSCMRYKEARSFGGRDIHSISRSNSN